MCGGLSKQTYQTQITPTTGNQKKPRIWLTGAKPMPLKPSVSRRRGFGGTTRPDGLVTPYHARTTAPAKKEAPATLEGAHGAEGLLWAENVRTARTQTTPALLAEQSGRAFSGPGRSYLKKK
jgi:hypothetical protein